MNIDLTKLNDQELKNAYENSGGFQNKNENMDFQKQILFEMTRRKNYKNIELLNHKDLIRINGRIGFFICLKENGNYKSLCIKDDNNPLAFEITKERPMKVIEIIPIELEKAYEMYLLTAPTSFIENEKTLGYNVE